MNKDLNLYQVIITVPEAPNCFYMCFITDTEEHAIQNAKFCLNNRLPMYDIESMTAKVIDVKPAKSEMGGEG